MSKLVEELKHEHITIIDTLNKIKELSFSSEEGQNTMSSAKKMFLSHLDKEDAHLYPVLYKAAKSDSNLKTNLDIFANDMEKISKNVLEFFNKYTTESSGIEFAKDFGTLYATLIQRIRREETIIYQKYDNLNK
jgi:hemerythrin-like domain-containing protein